MDCTWAIPVWNVNQIATKHINEPIVASFLVKNHHGQLARFFPGNITIYKVVICKQYYILNNIQEFNASKFVLFTSLLLFSILFTLQLDQVIHWSWWSIFAPLWIWKGLLIICCLLGLVFYLMFRNCYSWGRSGVICVVEKTTVKAQHRGVHPVQGHADKPGSPPPAPYVWAPNCW